MTSNAGDVYNRGGDKEDRLPKGGGKAHAGDANSRGSHKVGS